MAGAPFPAAHATPIVTGSRPAAPAITPPAPAPTAAGHSVAHSSAVVQPQQQHAAAAAPKAAATQAASSPLAPPARQAAGARQAASPRQAASGQQAHAQHKGPAAVVQHLAAHQGQGRAWHAVQGRHPRWRGHQAGRKQWPYLIYDSVTPAAIPSHHVVATYATGPYAASASDVADRKAIVWIDTRGFDPQAAALDVEPGDATPSMAASWAWHRLHAHPYAHAIIYTMRSEWAAAQASIAGLPHWMQNHVRWWIADPTGYPHVVPGSDATQWYWGTHYDITTANPGF